MHHLRIPASGAAHTSGDVSLDPSAVIAAGVILLADPKSQLVVGAGVCIGMGSVIHAQGGILILESGVILGAGVLVIGPGVIGQQSCIGTAVTLLQPQVAAGQVIPAGALITAVAEETVSALAPSAPPAPDLAPPPLEETTPPPQRVIGEVFLSQLRMTLFPRDLPGGT